jgi:hypothetical protein
MLELKVLVSIFMLTMSTFFHKYIVLLIGFCRVHNILLSVITMSWSDSPGSGLHLLTNDGLLVINRSRVLYFLVGKFTICSNKQSLNGGRSYNPTVRQSDSPTVRRSDSPIVRQML